MHRRLLLPLCAVFTLACTSEPDDGMMTDSNASASASTSESGTEDSSTTGTTAPDTETDTETDTGVDPIGLITGLLLDAQGAPLPSPLLQFCGTIDEVGMVLSCIPVTVDGSDGSFSINVLNAGLWSLKIVQAPGDGRFFTGQAFQLTVNEGDTLDYSDPPIVLPEVSSLTPLSGPTDVMIDDVLTITIDPAMAMSPDFVPPTDFGGLLVPEEFWRVPEIEGSPVLAGWSFSPFGIKSTMGGFPFTVNGNLGLAAGEAVVFWEIEKDNGSLHEIATGTVNAMATAIDVVPTGEGLHELTWLLVTQ